jgi:hypothetical protein
MFEGVNDLVLVQYFCLPSLVKSSMLIFALTIFVDFLECLVTGEYQKASGVEFPIFIIHWIHTPYPLRQQTLDILPGLCL